MDFKAVVVAILGCALGCGSSSGDTSGKTVQFRMEVIVFEPSEGDVPLEGVEVCVVDTDNCATSDVTGFVTLALPANSEIALTVLKVGYAPTIAPQLTTESDVDDLRTAVLSELS